MKAYHFTGSTLRDGRPLPAIGAWLEHTGPLVPCETGLHASKDPLDALEFAPGLMLHRVDCQGDVTQHGTPANKLVCRRRKILATVDAEPILREFARWCALRVIHLWDAPQVVRDYLTTGDESIRAAARDAAWAAARDAARDAARAAARDAAWAAARDAAWDAAWAAAWDAAWAAAWDAAWDAAWAAAWDAARAAAWDAARDAARAAARAAAWDAARDAAWDAARDAQRKQFKALVSEAFKAANKEAA